MGSHSYEESKKLVVKGMWLLAIVTLIEVFFSLLGKGHIIAGLEDNYVVGYATAFIIAVLSIYKAYFIIYKFMHMEYEAKGMAMSVLLPTGLLIWAVIAFFQEGNSWKERNDRVRDLNDGTFEQVEPKKESYNSDDTKVIDRI